MVVIEGDPEMAERIALCLRKDGCAVEVALNERDGLRLIRASMPDLVLLDLMLPRNGGMEVAQKLRSDSRAPGVPLIVMTSKNKKGDMIVGLHLGAEDFIIKPFDMMELVARIAAAFRRIDSGYANLERTIGDGPININQERHQVDVNGNPVLLTPTEFRLLSALVAAAGRVLTRNQLIDQAIGADSIATDRTIDVHLTALRRKLGETGKFLKTVRGVGYRMLSEHEDVD